MKKIYILICSYYNFLFLIIKKIFFLKINKIKESNLKKLGFELVKIKIILKFLNLRKQFNLIHTVQGHH